MFGKGLVGDWSYDLRPRHWSCSMMITTTAPATAVMDPLADSRLASVSPRNRTGIPSPVRFLFWPRTGVNPERIDEVERQPKNQKATRLGGGSGALCCSPNGIRTRAATLRGWCPRPLDDGAKPHRGRSHVCSWGARNRTLNNRTRICCVACYTTPHRVTPKAERA